MVWPEINQALTSHRYELVLNGEKLTKYFQEQNGFDQNLWLIKQLNFLELSDCRLIEILPEDIAKLKHLITLTLSGNRISRLPIEMKSLENLRHLNLSNNCLEVVDQDLFVALNQIETINFSHNRLQTFAQLSSLNNPKLSSIYLSNNQLENLSNVGEDFENLSFLDLSSNRFKQFPSTLCRLNSMKFVHLGSNEISQIPFEISQLPRLKEIRLESNPIKDNRLKKLIEQGKMKQIVEYLDRLWKEQEKLSSSNATTTTKCNMETKQETSDVALLDLIRVRHFDHSNSKGIQITVMDNVRSVRAHLLCVIITNLDLSTEGHFKKFLHLQNELHDDICQKRTLATIGTHDLSSLTSNLIYNARNARDIVIVPLGKNHKQMSALDFYQQLCRDAEQERKLKKRNQLSGLNKYLSLLENQESFAFLSDEHGNVLSLPPLTNCDKSKLTSSSKSILVEISSSHSMDICRRVMNAFLRQILQLQLVEQQEQEKMCDIRQILTLQQTRVVDDKGQLKQVYPSRTDLDWSEITSGSIRIERLFP